MRLVWLLFSFFLFYQANPAFAQKTASAASPPATTNANSAGDVNIDTLLKAAENGDSKSQYKLGDAYRKGLYGLPKDKAEAIKWTMAAAEAGNVHAQYKIAQAYCYGDETLPKDYIKSYMWNSIVIAQNTPSAIKKRKKGVIHDRAIILQNQLESIMSIDEIQQATDLAKQWMEAHKAQ